MTPEDRIRAVTARYDGPEGGEAAQLAEDALRRLEWRKRRGGKECARCHETKPVSAFGPDSRKSDGLQSICRPCDSARKKAV